MKFFFNSTFLILTLLIYVNKAFAQIDYQIRETCRKEIRKSKCIKDLQDKKLNLLKGNRIKIPVFPFKK